MAILDPHFVKFQEVKTKLLFAASQLQGEREMQEDYFVNFNDECFVVADGVGGMPHGEDASKLASETAIWAYKHIRQHPYYWEDKKLFMKRIFRSTNLAVWQKQREFGFEEGLATTLLVCIMGEMRYWIGSAGDTRAYIMETYLMRELTTDDLDKQGRLTKAVGFQRLGLKAQFATGVLKAGGIMLLATDGVTKYLSHSQIEDVLLHIGDTTESLTDGVMRLLKEAQKNGSTDNMTACMMKRVLK